jgi:Cu/Zn superoxide dismutase
VNPGKRKQESVLPEGIFVIVHAKPDVGGQPVGNAGARIGCGIIKLKAN